MVVAQLNQILELTSASNERTHTKKKTEPCKNNWPPYMTQHVIKCIPSYNGVAIKRCSWPPSTCVTHFSSNTENTPVKMLSTRCDFIKKKKNAHQEKKRDGQLLPNKFAASNMFFSLK